MNEESAAPLDSQEDESDFLLPGINLGFDAAVAASDWTTETIVSQLRKGNIDLDPAFQRREAWQRPRKSQFIESLILGIPTPQIILAERKERRGSYLVIDGKQRLLTLRQFTAADNDPVFKKFKLGGLLARSDLNRLSYEQLAAHPTSPLSALENANIRTVVIKSWSSEEFLYEVFLRINSGSVQLSPQELRQALHPGKFTDGLNEYTIESNGIRSVLNLSQPDFRMRDNELVLRYVAFRKSVDRYNGNLKQFLDDITLFYNKSWDTSRQDVERMFSDLDYAIDISTRIFGPNVFKKWNGYSFESRINRAVFDVVSYFFSFKDVAEPALDKSEEVIAELKRLCEDDPDFIVAITSTTKSVEAVQTRYRKWRDALQSVLNENIAFPRAR